MEQKIRPLFTPRFVQRRDVLRHRRGVRTDTRFDPCANYTMYGGALLTLGHREFKKDHNVLGVINRNDATWGLNSKTAERVDTFLVGVAKSVRWDNRKASVSFFPDWSSMLDLSESQVGVLFGVLTKNFPPNYGIRK